VREKGELRPLPFKYTQTGVLIHNRWTEGDLSVALHTQVPTTDQIVPGHMPYPVFTCFRSNYLFDAYLTMLSVDISRMSYDES
jgi:signal-transduction protein with cAMP-binding, CBS, and nucleotidyltransferase domain